MKLEEKLTLSYDHANYPIQEGNYSYYMRRTKEAKDFGFFEAEGTIYSCVSYDSTGTCDHDITEVTTVFILDGKRCQFSGFKELYEKLFGVNSFRTFNTDLSIEFQEEYFKQSPYKDK